MGTAIAAARAGVPASSLFKTPAPKATSFGATRIHDRTTQWLNAYTCRRIRPRDEVPSPPVLVFTCDPASKVAPPPEAFDLIEPRFAQEILVPSRSSRHQHALAREAFALDLFVRVPVRCLECVVAAHEQFLE